jgi:CHAD domain-containing protein
VDDLESPSRADRELEWQLDAPDLRPVVHWLEEQAAGSGADDRVTVTPRRTVSQVDVYLDTDDRRFHQAGYSLRIRRTGRRAGGEATLKALESAATAEHGLRNRRELSQELDQPDPLSLAKADGPVAQRVRAVAGRRPLQPLFEVRTRRRVFALEREGLPAGEVAVDETAIRPSSGGRPARLRRVEIEVQDGAGPAVEPLVDRLRAACGLQQAALTKYEAGIQSSRLSPPSAVDLGATEIDRDATIGAVALAVLRRHFGALLAREPGTRLGDDSEELHDMRVATRRLRAAIALFDDFLPADAVRAREDFAWLGQALGAVRDLDVQLEQLEQWLAGVPEPDRHALEHLRAELERQRVAARATMLEVLDSRRYAAFVARFGRLLRTRGHRRTGPAALPARAVAPDLIEQQFAAVRKAAKRISPGSEPADYHRLRIRCKRFRYAIEFLADLYPRETAPVVKRLVALQDILGLHQDADVAIARLRELALDPEAALPPATVFAMGEIAERYRQSMARLRKGVPAAYSNVEGKRWRSFRKAMEQQRPAPPAARAASPTPEAAAPPETKNPPRLS